MCVSKEQKPVSTIKPGADFDKATETPSPKKEGCTGTCTNCPRAQLVKNLPKPA